MFQVCKYDLKFKNCFVPLKWVRNKLAVKAPFGGFGAWLWNGVGEGRGQGGFEQQSLEHSWLC